MEDAEILDMFRTRSEEAVKETQKKVCGLLLQCCVWDPAQ